jgi:hypothetical protein
MVLSFGRRPLVLTVHEAQRDCKQILSVPTVSHAFDKNRNSIGIASYGVEGVE